MAGHTITTEIPVKEGCSWEWEGKGGFGIRMPIPETRNHVPLPASLQILPWIWASQPLLCCGFPFVNSSLLFPTSAGGCRLKSINVHEVLGYWSNVGPVSAGESRAGRSQMALRDVRWRVPANPTAVNPHSGNSI